MLTEALVVTWLGMCAVMLYSDPRLWIVVASSVTFAAVRMVAVPLVTARVKAFSTFSRSSQLLWCNTAVSMVHSALSSCLAIAALLSGHHSLGSDYVNFVTRCEFVATAVSTGYFAYDLWDYVQNGLYAKSPGIVLHHVVVLICYISALTKTVGVPLLSLALVCELHSVFMHWRKLLSMSNYSFSHSSLYRWVWQAQWATFALARVVAHVVVIVLTYRAQALFSQQLHFIMAFGGMIFINLLNAQLFVGVRKAYRRDMAPRSPTASKEDA